MTLYLHKSAITNGLKLKLTGSKSETNRLLLLQALYPNISIHNASVSDDSEVMAAAIATHERNIGDNHIDIHHAGTAMRFLTAFFAIQDCKKTILTGSDRMKQRPIKILVDALKLLGADIEYLENDGFPPIKIVGKNLINNKVSLSADVSSQYISALLLIAAKLENGIEITLLGEVTSVPYIKMTLALLNKIGVQTSFEGHKITVEHLAATPSKIDIVVESDWSSASYFYSIIALSPIGTSISLSSFEQNSLQADSVLASIYREFGVETIYDNKSIIIHKNQLHNPQPFAQGWDGANCPDIAQTIAVTAFGLGVSIHLKGLHTLKIKETDRLEALKTELSKFGASINVNHNSLTLTAHDLSLFHQSEIVNIATYQDHRMAMAFAPLALKLPINIENADVVSKSFPTFWDDLRKIGFLVS
jgi:3-phosphoshikimate 1-carboxyvinyltransferase